MDRGAWWAAVHKQLDVTQATQHAHEWNDREGSWKDSSPAAGRPHGVGTLWPCDPSSARRLGSALSLWIWGRPVLSLL